MQTITGLISSLSFLFIAAALLLWMGRRCRRVKPKAAATPAGGTVGVIESTGRALSGVFGTRVAINNRGVVAVPRGIAELAVLAHDTTVSSRLDKARVFGWFPSTLVLTGTCRGKLGIDLGQVKGRLDPVTRVLDLELPRSRILSVELIELESTYESRSWLTPLRTGELIDLARQNGRQGREQLDQAELLREADRALGERLHAAMAGLGVGLRLAEPAG